MLRRLLRLAAAGFCLLSLLACIAVGWLWWQSYRVAPGHVTFRPGAERYTVRSEPGRVVLLRPPPAEPGLPSELRSLIDTISDADLLWYVLLVHPDELL